MPAFSLFTRRTIPVPPLLREIARVFHDAGYQVYLVGGAVRDMIRGKTAADWDLASSAPPEAVSALFRHVIPTGVKHGTVTVRYKGRSIEVTTFRVEESYINGRHPEKVSWTARIEDDLARRDFTMNAIAAELPSGRLIDPFGGLADIKQKRIRCVGDPQERFNEDGLRALRALRFTAVLGFKPEENLLAAIPQTLAVSARVSAERLRAEFEKIIMSPDPASALELMRTTGLLKLVLPELAGCVGVEQKGYHRFDVFTHSILACRYAAQRGFSESTRLAALFHDIGKSVTAKLGKDGAWTFYNHERESAALTGTLMRRLRFSNALIGETAHLVACHMFHYEEVWTDGAVRRFLMRTGEEHLDALFKLRFADSYAMAAKEPPADMLLPFQRRIEAVRAKNSVLSFKDLAINGHDLTGAGVTEGRRVGIILRELLDAVLEDPALNEREKLLEIARNLMAQGI